MSNATKELYVMAAILRLAAVYGVIALAIAVWIERGGLRRRRRAARARAQARKAERSERAARPSFPRRSVFRWAGRRASRRLANGGSTPDIRSMRNPLPVRRPVTRSAGAATRRQAAEPRCRSRAKSPESFAAGIRSARNW